MKYLIVLVTSVLLFGADDLASLSKVKQDIQNYKQQENQANYEQEKYNWINPLNAVINYRLDTSVQDDAPSETKSAYISLNQDIFRSGGIYYAMSYAESKHRYDRTQWHYENAMLSQELFTALLTIRRSELQLKQSELKLKNSEIEIFIRRQQYEAGDIDITQLNSALMDRNRELQNAMSIKNRLKNAKIDLNNLSDQSEEEINLPQFSLISQEAFLKENYQIDAIRAQSDAKSLQHHILRSSYLPKLSLSAQYGISEYQNHDNSIEYDGAYYSVGIQLTIPLDYNRAPALQKSQAVLLRNSAELLEMQREQNNYYQQIKNNIENYQEYIELTRQNIELYRSLLDVTQKAVASGYKPGYDLETLQNTNAIDKYEIRISELNIQMELVKLHFLTQRLNDGK